MANIKITGYAELAAPISTDLVEVVSDPGGTPISKKAQIRNLFKGGGQIAFPATAVPSADPNTMDDYEEGTWTPDLQFGGAKVDMTYSIQAGSYTKSGDIVVYNANIILTSKGSSVGIATIAAFPFVLGARTFPVSISFRNITFANMLTCLRTAGILMYFYETTEAGVLTNLVNSDFANDSRFEIGGVYKI